MRRWTPFSLLVAVVMAAALPATADPDPPVGTFEWSANMEPLGWSPRPNPTSGVFNSDLAFWGQTAYQGTYDGFQIIDISNPEDPLKILDYNQCAGGSVSNQGDVIVWDDILVRSWNSNTPTAPPTICDGDLVMPGFEGLHVFDISNPLDPDLVAQVDLPCGSHTASGVPDLENGRLLVYNSSSSGTCGGIEIVDVPLADPAGAAFLRLEPAGRSCHDTSIILGDAMLAACAGGNGLTVWSLAAGDGGSLTDPAQLYSQAVAGVSIAHSTSFSWDGEILIFGHEPGGGSQAQCQESSSLANKTLFFFDSRTGIQVGQWMVERPQSSTENCTIHNFNVIPTERRNIVVIGSYQMGISVVDFTDPATAHMIAFADPAPLTPQQLGGDWSSYWYDGIIYESDITRGLLTWRLNDERTLGFRTLGHLNPQTQERTTPFVEDLSITKEAAPDPAHVHDMVTYTLTVQAGGPDGAEDVLVTDTLPGSVQFSSATSTEGSCVHDGSSYGGEVTCDLGFLEAGDTATVLIVVTPRDGGTMTNTAQVSAFTLDPDPSNNTATATTTVNPKGAPGAIRVTGGGSVAGASADTAGFGLNAQVKDGVPRGNVNVVDHGTGQHVRSVQIDEVVPIAPNQMRISGMCSVDGGPAEPCEVLATDAGQPGAGVDEFRIIVGGSYVAGGTLLRGNIKMH